MSANTKYSRKAARLVVLYQLDRSGQLEGRTLQELADIFEVGHRSTILRDLRTLEEVKRILPEVKANLRSLPMKDER